MLELWDEVVDKTVVKVLQAGWASIMGGGVGAGNVQDVQETRDAQETQDDKRCRMNRWMRKGDTVHTLACVQHVCDTRDKSIC